MISSLEASYIWRPISFPTDNVLSDWYHNTAVIIFACLASWFVAVIGGGLAWIFIVMAVCGAYYRTSLRRVRRNFRDDINREMAKKTSETDHESLEWMNDFLIKFWPIYAPVLAKSVIASVDQVLSTSTPAFLDSMRMSFFTLGSKPPRMEYVKSYPKADDDTVVMDWRFSFTPNDVADMTTRQLKNKINPKVILEIRIGKAMISKAMPIIVEDFAFSGLMQVKIKLQIPFPHVERVEICFLEKPDIDYVCKPIGGDMLGFDINFIPGLESFIKDQIHANVGPIMYAPNVFPIEVAKMLSGSAVDQAIGVVAITIYGAQGLKNPDKFAGSPDSYAVVSLNSRDALAQTKIIRENSNPKWNETKYIILTSLTDNLTLQIYDYNEYRKDKELGTCTFPLEKLEQRSEHVNEQLEVMANGKPRGLVSADIKFFPVLEGRKLEDGKQEPPPESNTGIARFVVEQAKDLDGTKSLIGQLNPYAILLLNNREIFVSKKLKRTNNPVWEDAHKEILITDRKNAKLGLVIKDDRDLAVDTILGTYQIKLDDMIDLMEKGQEWYSLAGVKTGRAKMMLKWKPVALAGVGAGTGGYVTPIGVMRIHIKNARDLRNVETMGKSDPYTRILLSGIEKARTVTFQNNLNPDWDEVLYVPMHNTREKLILETMDQENIGKDRSLGLIEISASDYIKQAENGECLVHDEKRPIAGSLRMNNKGIAKGTLNYAISFYPCLNIADPEEEEKKEGEAKPKSATDAGRLTSLENGKPEATKDAVQLENEKKQLHKIDPELEKKLAEGEKEQHELGDQKTMPKIRLSPEELLKHESGLIIFKLLDCDLIRSNVQIEVVVDDMAFPSYISSTIRTKQGNIDEIGDCFVRELDFSKLTIRLREPSDKSDEKKDRTVAKLTGNTLDTLKQCLVRASYLLGELKKLTIV
jgi:Ca2+-dependent lipid-binding protein